MGLLVCIKLKCRGTHYQMGVFVCTKLKTYVDKKKKTYSYLANIIIAIIIIKNLVIVMLGSAYKFRFSIRYIMIHESNPLIDCTHSNTSLLSLCISYLTCPSFWWPNNLHKNSFFNDVVAF